MPLPRSWRLFPDVCDSTDAGIGRIGEPQGSIGTANDPNRLVYAGTGDAVKVPDVVTCTTVLL